MEYIENRTYDEIKVGDTASLVRTLKPEDIQLFAAMSGDINPAYLDPEYAKSNMFHEVIAHGMWGGALISTVLGTQLPGPGTIYLDQSLHFARPVTLGDTITVTIIVTGKFEHHHHVTLDCQCVNQNGLVVMRGTAEVMAPRDKVRRPRIALPGVRVTDKTSQYRRLIAMAEEPAPIPMAVVHPCDSQSLLGALEAAKANLIVPFLIGPEAKIRAVARAEDVDLSPYKIIDVAHSHAAANLAVAMARDGTVQALMKGSLHTDELMAEVIASETGLRTARRISHVFLMDVPTYPRMLLITDAAININPSLEEKVDIVQNAIDLAQVLQVGEPKVAILSAVELVTPKLRSTLDAAALCKMADRGQITGGVLDGPLAFDNAVSIVAAKTKGIKSAVAGHADILLVPDLEAGNMIAKQLEYLANAQAAGIVLGARVPIVLTSRADTVQTRLASCAVALLLAYHRRKKGA
ncbi:MAG: bifunctional enoyl-CoA hydratase/phosphate acetyltransferase [Betaproteobacteria bacterium]|nr:bifunctional enoyl-CoA hydratase/phosphate acetyltransferase [Betaproteobacteria bacterium]